MRRAAVATLVAGIVASGCTGGSGSSGSVPPSPATSSRATASLVATFRGTSARTTRPFTVATGWEIRFEIRTASAFSVSVLDATGAVAETPIGLRGPGGGSSFPKSTGQVSLRIQSAGRWVVRVLSR